MDERLVSASTMVEASSSAVFAILADPRQHPRIDGSGSVKQLISGPERLSRGAQFTVAMRLFGAPYTITNRVVEFEQDRLIAWRHFGAHRWRYQLEPVEGAGTRVTETFDYSRYAPPAAWTLQALGFPERNRRGIAGTLARLKTAAEADTHHWRREPPD